MWALISTGFKAFLSGLNLAEIWSKYFIKKDDQNTGRQLQNADTLKANAEQATNADIIEENNAALSHDALTERLRQQTGARP